MMNNKQPKQHLRFSFLIATNSPHFLALIRATLAVICCVCCCSPPRSIHAEPHHRGEHALTAAFGGAGDDSPSARFALPLSTTSEALVVDHCDWRHNETSDYGKLSGDQREMLQECLWHHIEDRARERSTFRDPRPMLTAPAQYPLQVNIESYAIEHVDMFARHSSQLSVHGTLYVSWNDTRLGWNKRAWLGLDEITLSDPEVKQIWTPTFSDESSCTFADGSCTSHFEEIEVSWEGRVSGRLDFRYPAFCRTDYRSYPEERNDCCMYVSVVEFGRTVHYSLLTQHSQHMPRPLSVNSRLSADASATPPVSEVMVVSNIEISPWAVLDKSIELVEVFGIRQKYIQICVHAKKSMPTLRIALRIPVMIATMLMLVSPLFGDLRTQAFVKLLTLTLQTMCFLYLCSIAPENGFGGTKPKIYSFYEFTFTLTFLSILITVICLALCRLKRAIPASHGLFLAAKMINNLLCCTEPDEATNYQRHLDTAENGAIEQRGPSTIGGGGGGGGVGQLSPLNDYSLEWRHIYIAVNNLCSGICFSLFCFVTFFDIM